MNKNPYKKEPIGASGFTAFLQEEVSQPEQLNVYSKKHKTKNDTDARVHFKVFRVFKLWESCFQCRDEIWGPVDTELDEDEEYPKKKKRGAPTKLLPETGCYECPHVQVREYEDLLSSFNDTTKVFYSEDKHILKDGSIQIAVTWIEKPDAKKNS
jgi:hypothetical protein